MELNALVACEESQAVCKALLEMGWNAFSCDIQPCSGGRPDRHIQGDVLPLLNGNCEFETMDGKKHHIDGKWDLVIAHPPCTFLTVAANKYYDVKKYGVKALQRAEKREQAAEFFMRFVCAKCERIAIENPVGVMSTKYQKPTQIIQPYQFGHPYTKTTCLWLKGLPPLTPTNILQKPENGWENQQITKDGRYGGYGGKWGCKANGKWLRYGDPRVAKERSKTFPGIAKAMAEQWGKYIEEERKA